MDLGTLRDPSAAGASCLASHERAVPNHKAAFRTRRECKER
jgi:hypothetical protein